MFKASCNNKLHMIRVVYSVYNKLVGGDSLYSNSSEVAEVRDICQLHPSVVYYIQGSCLLKLTRTSNVSDAVFNSSCSMNMTSGGERLLSCYAVNSSHLVLVQSQQSGTTLLLDTESDSTYSIGSSLYKYNSFIKLTENIFYGLVDTGIEIGFLLSTSDLLVANHSRFEKLPLYLKPSLVGGEEMLPLSGSVLLVRTRSSLVAVDIRSSSVSTLCGERGVDSVPHCHVDLTKAMFPAANREMVFLSSGESLLGIHTTRDLIG